MEGILHESALQHYALLVKSAFTLLQIEVSEAELNECEQDLIKFVAFYEMYYGQENMTFNVHALLHVCESVRQTGPLCMNSAFSFESYIYTLKTFVNGPTAMDQQMARKHFQTLIFKTGNKKLISPSEEVINYCRDLFSKKRLTFYKQDEDNVTYLGRGRTETLDNESECLAYLKCIYKGIVYHSCEYNRAKKNRQYSYLPCIRNVCTYNADS